MSKQRIYNQKGGALNAEDRLTLGRLLLKAGYCVKEGKEKDPTKKNSYIHFVDFWTDENS